MLMKDSLKSGVEAANAQEREAYADPEYVQLIKGMALASSVAATKQSRFLDMRSPSVDFVQWNQLFTSAIRLLSARLTGWLVWRRLMRPSDLPVSQIAGNTSLPRRLIHARILRHPRFYYTDLAPGIRIA